MMICISFGYPVQIRYSYEPYGKTTTNGVASANSSQYAGRKNDGTGIYFYRARYYDPGTHRFASVDPIGLKADPNGYAYVENNPISYIDPEDLLITNTLGALQRGVTGDQAATYGAPGNAAATAATAEGAGYSQIPRSLLLIRLQKNWSDRCCRR